MICIFCRTEQEPTAEHVIAKALGGSFVIDRACRKCNSRLGDIADRGLIEHNESVVRRVALKLAGNNGSVGDPDVRVRLTKTPEGLRAKVEPKIEIEFDTLPDGRRIFGVTTMVIPEEDADKAEMYLRSALRKKGIRDEEMLARVCAELLPNLELRVGPETVAIPVKKNEGGHHLGITKIVYEMAHHWLGDAWLDDPIAETMRQGLLGNKDASGKYKVADGDAIPRPRVAADPGISFDKLPLGYDPTRTNVITLYPHENKLWVTVYLLDAFTAMYLVSDNAAAYQRPEYDAVAMDVDERTWEDYRTVLPVISSN
jgi:hypothetical protein